MRDGDDGDDDDDDDDGKDVMNSRWSRDQSFETETTWKLTVFILMRF